MEAVSFNLKWKIPCVCFYKSSDEPPRLANLTFSNPITAEVFKEDKSLAQKVKTTRLSLKQSQEIEIKYQILPSMNRDEKESLSAHCRPTRCRKKVTLWPSMLNSSRSTKRSPSFAVTENCRPSRLLKCQYRISPATDLA